MSLAASKLERTLLEIWRDVLKDPSLCADDNLFDHGSRSVALLRVHLELKETYDIDVPLPAMFDLITVTQFVDFIGQRG